MFRVERGKGTVLYIQLRNQIRSMIDRGILREGEMLPPERDLASELGISRTTVSIAYRELAAEGYLVARQGRGTAVAAGKANPAAAEQIKADVAFVDAVLDSAADFGLELEDFLEIAALRVKDRKESPVRNRHRQSQG